MNPLRKEIVFNSLKNWWITPAKYPLALAIGGISYGLLGIGLFIKMVKSTPTSS